MVGTAGEHDTVLSLVVDQNRGNARSGVGDAADMAVIDAIVTQRRAQLLAEGIIAETADHGHRDAARAQARTGNRLIGALATGNGAELAAGDGFAWERHARHA